MIAASKPSPATTRKMCSSGCSCWPERSTRSRPTSTRLFWPVRATARARSIESTGRSRLRGEQVPGAAGEESEGGLGADERRRNGADGAVPTEGADEDGALGDGLSRLAGAGVGCGGLEPDRLPPALGRAGIGDAAAQGREVVELRRVDDDRGAFQRSRLVSFSIGPELVAVRAAPPARPRPESVVVRRRMMTTAPMTTSSRTTPTSQRSWVPHTG